MTDDETEKGNERKLLSDTVPSGSLPRCFSPHLAPEHKGLF